MPAAMKPVLYRLLHAMVEVDSGRMHPRTGAALATLATAAVRVYEVSTLEERLESLERELRDGVRHAG